MHSAREQDTAICVCVFVGHSGWIWMDFPTATFGFSFGVVSRVGGPKNISRNDWLPQLPRQFWTASVNCKNHKCTNLGKGRWPVPISEEALCLFRLDKNSLAKKNSNSPWKSQIYVASMYIYDLWESWASWWFCKGAKELCWSKIPFTIGC